MEMDKRTILAIALSIGIIIFWNYLFPAQEINKQQREKELAELRVKQEEMIKEKEAEMPVSTLPDDTSSVTIIPKTLIINGDLVHREISNTKGVHFKEYLLQDFRSTNKFMVNSEKKVSLINSSNQHNGFFAKLHFISGDSLDLRARNFELVDSTLNNIRINGEQKVEFRAKVKGVYVYQVYTFYENRYDYVVSYDFSALAGQLKENGLAFQWRNGLPYTEDNVQEDENMSLVHLVGENEFYRFDTADDEGEAFTDSKFNHLTVRTKYFIHSIMPENFDVSDVYVSQKAIKLSDYSMRRYNINFKTNELAPKFTMVTGPYKRELLNEFSKKGLDDIFFSASSYENFFSIFSKPLHFILVWMNGFIGSFGLTIILFTIILKIALYPLTKKSYKGMKAMSELQPRMAKLKEKHAGDQVAMQHAMRNLYSEAGVNPLAGCLPMLLQMPLLFSLFHVFRAAVELRGESFLWIQNFAAPDAFPIGLDAIGFATINLLPILLAASQMLTSKQTMTDPNQKAMVYVMPLVMMFMFYNWNAALNFYYLLFNVFTSIQQKMIKGPEKEVKGTKEIKPDGFEINEKSSKPVVSKNKKQMYKKKN